MVAKNNNKNKKVPVVQAYAYTKYLGIIHLDFDDNGNIMNVSGNPVLLDSSFAEGNNNFFLKLIFVYKLKNQFKLLKMMLNLCEGYKNKINDNDKGAK